MNEKRARAEDELFVERQALFQYGERTAVEDDWDSLAEAERRRRSSLFMMADLDSLRIEPRAKWTPLRHDPARSIGDRWRYDEDGPNIKGFRNAQLLNGLERHGLAGRAVADMQDAVTVTDSALPVFQYNRVRGARNAILWPLAEFTDIGDPRFVDPARRDPLAFKEKRPVAFWRGAPVGHSTLGGERRNIQFIVRDHLDGKVSRDELHAHLRTLVRYRLVEDFADRPGFDLGFVLPPHIPHFAEVELICSKLRPAVEPEEQAPFRFLLALSGNDSATSFPWQAQTNSVVLRETYRWEAFYDGHFVPWLHYVPFGSDLSDLTERVDWCLSNPDAANRLSSEAQSVCARLARQDLRDAAIGRLLARYRTDRGDGGGDRSLSPDRRARPTDRSSRRSAPPPSARDNRSTPSR